VTNRLLVRKCDHSAVAPMPGHSLSPLSLDLAPIHMIGGRCQVDETGLPKVAARAGSRQQRQVGGGHRTQTTGSHGSYFLARGLASPNANPSIKPNSIPAASHSNHRIERVPLGLTMDLS
jgi:hypothetical protein